MQRVYYKHLKYRIPIHIKSSNSVIINKITYKSLISSGKKSKGIVLVEGNEYNTNNA